MIQIFLTLVAFLFFTACSTTRSDVARVEEKKFQYRAVAKKETPKKENAPLIVVDAGHGGFDLGAHSKIYEEKNICLKASILLRKHLEQKGYRVIMTRSYDEYLPLKKRAEIANHARCQALVSLHCNSAKSTTAKGIEIFYTQKTEGHRSKRSKQLAQNVLTKLLSATGADSRGIKEANFCVIRETKMPSILIETGFLTNEDDRKKLQSDLYLDTLTKSIAEGIDHYFQSIE